MTNACVKFWEEKTERVFLIMIHNAMGSVVLWDALNTMFGSLVCFSDMDH